MLLRLSYLAESSVFTVMSHVPVSGSEKDIEILMDPQVHPVRPDHPDTQRARHDFAYWLADVGDFANAATHDRASSRGRYGRMALSPRLPRLEARIRGLT